MFYPALDGLRAIAFLMIFGVHYIQLPWGGAGVDIFFVLSGFLITGILFDTRDDRFRARNFYLRRTLRIFPLYYACLLLCVLTYPVFHWAWNVRVLAWPLYLGNFLRYLPAGSDPVVSQYMTDLQPHGLFHGHRVYLYMGHFWSLCLEEQFYLLWPAVVFWIRDRRKLMWICAASIPLCLLARMWTYTVASPFMLARNLLWCLLPFRLDALLSGGLLALLLRGPERDTVLRVARAAAWPALLLVGLWFALTPYGDVFARPYSYPAHQHTVGLTIIDTLGALLILLAVDTSTWTFRVLRLRPLRWLGRLSYGAYVFHDVVHPICGFAVSRIAPSATWLTATFGLALTIPLAWASFRWFETPFLNLKERWTRRPAAATS